MNESDTVKIKLTPHNLFYAGFVGVTRQVKGMDKVGSYGVNNSTVGWQINCDGACGELAVAKYLGVFYDGAIGDFTAKDAGDLQVRTTPYEQGNLILHPKDSGDDIFVLVLSYKSPVFILRGWIYGRVGKQKKWWRDGGKGRPAYWVSQADLRPMSELKENRGKDVNKKPEQPKPPTPCTPEERKRIADESGWTAKMNNMKGGE